MTPPYTTCCGQLAKTPKKWLILTAKLQPLAGEIAWTKNTLILDRCQNPLQREFYQRACARFGWTRRVLEHQIDNQTYEKYLLNQTSFDNVLPQAAAAQANHEPETVPCCLWSKLRRTSFAPCRLHAARRISARFAMSFASCSAFQFSKISNLTREE